MSGAEDASGTHGGTQIPLIASTYRLPWSRFQRAEPWMKAEVDAVKFDESGVPTMWCVREGGCVLSKDDLDWEYEPQPSSRDADFIARTRFSTAEEAAACAARYFEGLSK